MKKGWKYIIVALLSIVAITWISQTDFEFGKYDSFEETLEKGIPYEVREVIHTFEVDGITVLMYTTEPDPEAFTFAEFDALAVAFLAGNDEDGWENIGSNGWEHYPNDNLTVYSKRLHRYDRQGKKMPGFEVVFGEINHPEITSIETKSKREEAFEAATMITKNDGRRFYFQVGMELIVQGISKDGKMINRQGG